MRLLAGHVTVCVSQHAKMEVPQGSGLGFLFPQVGAAVGHAAGAVALPPPQGGARGAAPPPGGAARCASSGTALYQQNDNQK
jgi:hypothetical protein